MTEVLLTTGGMIVVGVAILTVLFAPSTRGIERLERLISAWYRR